MSLLVVVVTGAFNIFTRFSIGFKCFFQSEKSPNKNHDNWKCEIKTVQTKLKKICMNCVKKTSVFTIWRIGLTIKCISPGNATLQKLSLKCWWNNGLRQRNYSWGQKRVRRGCVGRFIKSSMQRPCYLSLLQCLTQNDTMHGTGSAVTITSQLYKSYLY